MKHATYMFANRSVRSLTNAQILRLPGNYTTGIGRERGREKEQWNTLALVR